jgi:RNA polymerase sigma-70 factor (ECF subfamily)
LNPKKKQLNSEVNDSKENISTTGVMLKISSGDMKAFERVFREYYSPLTLYAQTFLQDKDAAEEVVQELFYQLWSNRKQIEIKTSLKSYLYQAVRNRSLKVIRHNSVKQKHADLVMGHTSELVHENEIEARELQQIITSILAKLPEKCSLIFRMNRFEGLRYREIAEELSVSVKTVEANMSRALSLLRNEIYNYSEYFGPVIRSEKKRKSNIC